MAAAEFVRGGQRCPTCFDGVHERVALENRPDAVLGEVVPFEGEDDEQLVHVFADRLHPPFAPGPDFRGDVVEDADAVLLGPAGHLHIEARIIHQDQHVGGERLDVLPALFHLAADRPQVFDYFDDAEKRGFLIMFGQIPAASDPGHLVPAPEVELRLGVVGFQPFHQVGAVQVARRLAGYQVVTHIVSLILLSANRAAAVWCAPRPAPPSSGRFGRNCPRGARRALSSR